MEAPVLPGNACEGRQERIRWNAELERSREVAKRANAKRQKQREEWEAEIAQFDEEEATWRRIGEIEFKKE